MGRRKRVAKETDTFPAAKAAYKRELNRRRKAVEGAAEQANMTHAAPVTLGSYQTPHFFRHLGDNQCMNPPWSLQPPPPGMFHAPSSGHLGVSGVIPSTTLSSWPRQPPPASFPSLPSNHYEIPRGAFPNTMHRPFERADWGHTRGEDQNTYGGNFIRPSIHGAHALSPFSMGGATGGAHDFRPSRFAPYAHGQSTAPRHHGSVNVPRRALVTPARGSSRRTECTVGTGTTTPSIPALDDGPSSDGRRLDHADTSTSGCAAAATCGDTRTESGVLSVQSLAAVPSRAPITIAPSAPFARARISASESAIGRSPLLLHTAPPGFLDPIVPKVVSSRARFSEVPVSPLRPHDALTGESFRGHAVKEEDLSEVDQLLEERQRVHRSFSNERDDAYGGTAEVREGGAIDHLFGANGMIRSGVSPFFNTMGSVPSSFDLGDAPDDCTTVSPTCILEPDGQIRPVHRYHCLAADAFELAKSLFESSSGGTDMATLFVMIAGLDRTLSHEARPDAPLDPAVLEQLEQATTLAVTMARVRSATSDQKQLAQMMSVLSAALVPEPSTKSKPQAAPMRKTKEVKAEKSSAKGASEPKSTKTSGAGDKKTKRGAASSKDGPSDKRTARKQK